MANLYPEFFKRLDERADALFYVQPRLVTHIDAGAQQAAHNLYDERLQADGHILDLMSSYRSHLPDKFAQVEGLGLNQQEMDENPLLDDSMVYDINTNAELPFASNQFDGVVCTASVQYMTRPDDTFVEVARILKPGCPFIVTFSNRMFPSKAVLAWRASDDAAHIRLVKSYFDCAPAFERLQVKSYTPEGGDPLYAVMAYKAGLSTKN